MHEKAMFLLPGMFLGFDIPVFSSLIESRPTWVPNCADDVPVRGVRACAGAPGTGTSAAQWGPHFILIGTRRVKNPSNALKDDLL